MICAWKPTLLAGCLLLLTTITTYDSIALDGVVPLLQDHFAINNSQTALMKTISSTATTAVLLLMWAAGDRLGRRLLLLSAGVAWTAALCVSVVSGSGQYWMFILAQTIVSCSAAVIMILVPVILADLYTDSSLAKAIMCNTLMELVGNLIASSLASVVVSGNRAWQLMFIPLIVISLAAIVIVGLLLPSDLGFSHYAKRSLFDSLKLLRVKSYLLLTAASVAAGWYTKVNYFWMPTFMLSAWTYVPEVYFNLPYAVVMTLNAVGELAGSLIGLPLWITIAESWQFGLSLFAPLGCSPRALPIITTLNTFGLLLASLAMILMAARSYIVVFLGACLSGLMGYSAVSITTQMILTVSDARRRASALSLQRLLINMLAIPGPQTVGALADAFHTEADSVADRFASYQKALLLNTLSLLLSCSFAFASIFTYTIDARNVRGPLRVEASESDALLPSSSSRPLRRSSSVLEQSLMGRRATMESVTR